MHWDQILTVFAIIATNLGTVLALYMQLDRKLEENRKEANDRLEENRKETNDRLEENRKEASERLEESRRETNDILKVIHAEIKEFHGRLCSIEERTKSGKNS